MVEVIGSFCFLGDMVVSETSDMADGLERGKSESEEISSEKVKLEN